MAEDKKTIGLTDANKAIMEQLIEKAGFEEGMDAAKFAFAYAVSHNCEPGSIEGVGTIWNVGSFDGSGDIKALIQNLYPTADSPYRAMESLMNAGFALLGKEMKSNPSIRVEDLLKEVAAAPSKG